MSTTRPRPAKLDVNQLAASIVSQATGQPVPSSKDPIAVSLGRRGGLKGGKARAAVLSATARKAIAKKAADARWGNHPTTDQGAIDAQRADLESAGRGIIAAGAPRKPAFKPKRARRPQSDFTVYVEQVNQQAFTVRASSPEEAAEKGYRKWRRDYAHSRVASVELGARFL